VNHQADCNCKRCTIPLLQDLPPLPPKGKAARAERVARIFAEAMAERRAREPRP
jgi:hypothetical protein